MDINLFYPYQTATRSVCISSAATVGQLREEIKRKDGVDQPLALRGSALSDDCLTLTEAGLREGDALTFWLRLHRHVEQKLVSFSSFV
jgi:hypothetical protein